MALLLATVAFTVASTALGAQSAVADSIASRMVAPGVVYRHIGRPAGPWSIDVVEVDLRRSDLVVESVRALDSLRGRETTSSMARRSSGAGSVVLVAVNADFFDVKSGESVNNQIERGAFVRALSGPRPPAGHVRSQLALTRARKPFIERFLFDGAWLTRWGPVGIGAINVIPHANALVLFNRYYGSATPRDTLDADVAEVALVPIARRGDTVVYRMRGEVHTGGGTRIPPNGVVLAGYGASRSAPR
ncbi:MAG TPA: hypothetical protein VIQ74_06860, partial [Gemmatimonadaceae bacterium]